MGKANDLLIESSRWPGRPRLGGHFKNEAWLGWEKVRLLFFRCTKFILEGQGTTDCDREPQKTSNLFSFIIPDGTAEVFRANSSLCA